LIGLGVGASWLEIQNLLATVPEKDVAVAPNSHLKPETRQEVAQPGEWDASIRGARQDLFQESRMFAHGWTRFTL
jgi:hypothetical protein